MVASRRNFIKRVFACFHSGHARFYRSYNAGSERHDNTIQFVVTTRICVYIYIYIYVCVYISSWVCLYACTYTDIYERVRILRYAYMHACIPEERAGVPRARQNDRSQKLRNESPRVLTLARRPPKSRLSSFRWLPTPTHSIRAVATSWKNVENEMFKNDTLYLRALLDKKVITK